MNRIFGRQSGFSLLELMVAVAAVLVLGSAGWVVYQHQRGMPAPSSPVSTSSANKQSAADSAQNTTDCTTKRVAGVAGATGQQMYRLTYEHATFRYPAAWDLADQSCQGSDGVTLSGPDSFVVSISTGGLGHPSNDGPAPVLAAVSVTFLGKTGYLDYTSFGSDNVVDKVSLSQSPTEFLNTFTSKATGMNETPGGNFVITADYSSPDHAIQGLPVAQAKTDPNYRALTTLVESMTY